MLPFKIWKKPQRSLQSTSRVEYYARFVFVAKVISKWIVALENLPNEVQHLLHEIRHKDSRSQGRFDLGGPPPFFSCLISTRSTSRDPKRRLEIRSLRPS